MRCKLLLILLAISALAILSAPGAWTNQGAALCTAATYADLPAGEDDGTLCTVDADNSAWRYNVALGLWMPPDIQPAAAFIDYDGSVLPADAAPAWTRTISGGAGCSEASDGSVLTVTDASAGCNIGYQIRDLDDIVFTKNVVVLMRTRVTDQDAGAEVPSRWELGLHPGDGATYQSAVIGISGQTSKDNETNAQEWQDTTEVVGAEPSYSAKPSDWNVFYIAWFKDEKRFKWGVLGKARMGDEVWGGTFTMGTNWRLGNACPCTYAVKFTAGGLGSSYGAVYGPTVTAEVDWLKVANFD
jgi:hypothetical protein